MHWMDRKRPCLVTHGSPETPIPAHISRPASSAASSASSDCDNCTHSSHAPRGFFAALKSGGKQWDIRVRFAALGDWPRLHATVTSSQVCTPASHPSHSPLHECVHALLQEEYLDLEGDLAAFLQQFPAARRHFVKEFAAKHADAWEMFVNVSRVGDISTALKRTLLRCAAQFVLCVNTSTPSHTPAAHRRSPRLGGGK